MVPQNTGMDVRKARNEAAIRSLRAPNDAVNATLDEGSIILNKLAQMGLQGQLVGNQTINGPFPAALVAEQDMLDAGVDPSTDLIFLGYAITGRESDGLHNVKQTLHLFFDGSVLGFNSWMADLGLQNDPWKIPGVTDIIRAFMKV